MIKVVAKYRLKPGVREEYLEIARELAEETKKEEGCIQYVLYEDIKEPAILTMIEEWTDEEAINAHMESAHMKRIIPELRALRESTEINLYRQIL